MSQNRPTRFSFNFFRWILVTITSQWMFKKCLALVGLEKSTKSSSLHNPLDIPAWRHALMIPQFHQLLTTHSFMNHETQIARRTPQTFVGNISRTNECKADYKTFSSPLSIVETRRFMQNLVKTFRNNLKELLKMGKIILDQRFAWLTFALAAFRSLLLIFYIQVELELAFHGDSSQADVSLKSSWRDS